MAINLATKYETKLDERFTQQSITEAAAGKEFDFDGVNAIKLWTLGKAVINNYTTSPSPGVSRFGAIHEVEDEVNTYQLMRKLSFNESFDITNVQDQMFIKKANAFLKQVWDEQFVPMVDHDRLHVWTNGAGHVTVGAALTEQTVVKAILQLIAILNNARVPKQNRFIFVRESTSVNLALSDHMKYNEAFTTGHIVNGQVGKLKNTPIIEAADDLMPDGVEVLVKYKRASADPQKLRMLRVLPVSENVAGSLMQGLVRFDSFVLANKADGIAAYVNTGSAVATPTASLSSSKIALASTTAGATIYYTTDGSNPKTSSTRSVYSSTLTVVSGTTLKFYAEKTGLVSSGIVSVLEDDVT